MNQQFKIIMCFFHSLYLHKFLILKNIYIYLLDCARSGLICGMQDLVPWSRIEPGSPGLGAQSLSHWTTKEVFI